MDAGLGDWLHYPNGLAFSCTNRGTIAFDEAGHAADRSCSLGSRIHP